MKDANHMFDVFSKKNLFYVYMGVCALSFGFIVFLLVSRKSFEDQFEQTRFLLSKTEVAVDQLQKEKVSILKENEKLQVDALAYVALNNELQQEKESLQVKLKQIERNIEEQKKELVVAQQYLLDMQKTSRDKKDARDQLVKERDQMRSDLKALEVSVNRERGIYHYNLAVAYTKATLLKKAVQEYKKSLEYDPNNAEAHYNLGLLYKKFGDDPAKAMVYFRQYLELKPDANDAQEVRNFIDDLLELANRRPATF